MQNYCESPEVRSSTGRMALLQPAHQEDKITKIAQLPIECKPSFPPTHCTLAKDK